MPFVEVPPLMAIANRIDVVVCELLRAVEDADLDDLADEARSIKMDIRSHAKTLLEILDAIDGRLEE